MAEGKQVPLNIIIRTVDRATAGIEAINKKLDELTRPTREFGKALKELGEKSGVNKVSDAFREVRKASKETFIRLLEGAAIIGETTHLVLEMVESFATLNDTAERVGVSVDALSGLRYAASKSGASVEQLDAGVTTFVENLGGLKAGTGKLVKFLGEVSPAMLTQLKATRTTEEALGILAAGMEKLTNKAKLLKFAQAALGDPALAAVFHRGPQGIKELTDAYAKLAGPQKEAAERASKVDDVMKDLHAATDGVKAALVTGLSPALTEIIGKLTEWLAGHREDVARWAEDIGKKLPAAVDKVVGAVTGAVKWVIDFVEDIGGWKVAALGMAAVMTGPLIGAIATLSAALVATPFGLVVTGLAAIAAGVVLISGKTEAFEAIAERLGLIKSKKKLDPVEEFKALQDEAMRDARHDAIMRAAAGNDEIQQRVMKNLGLTSSDLFNLRETPHSDAEANQVIETARMQNDQNAAVGMWANNGIPTGPQPIKMEVKFTNAPKGTTVSTSASSNVDIDIDHTVGYQMGSAW